MDIKQLSCFAAVYEHANLSHTASLMAVAQSALSHHIAILKSEIGTPLFTRKPRGMEPTAAGHRLCIHARAILKSLRAPQQDMRRDSEEIAVGLPFSLMKGKDVPLMRAILTD